LNFTEQKLEVVINQFEAIKIFQAQNKIFNDPKVYYDFGKLKIKDKD
jgi:hypothetical protein